MDVSPAPSPESLSVPDNLVEAGIYPSPDAAFEHSLVVLAMGRACWLIPSPEGHRLMVEPFALAEVNRQIRCFDRESVGWPPTPPPAPPHPRQIHLFSPLLWALATIAVFWAEAANPQWIDLGALDRNAVMAHQQWWRTGTALFLHADTGHLISNLISGVFIFSLVLSTFGLRRGWALLAGAAVSANAIVVMLNHDAAYRSIGASTAVFAGVGLLTGAAVRRMLALRGRHRWRAIFTPLASGATVLALYGAGGVHIDVGAHVMGFVTGIVLGLLFRTVPAPE